MKNSIATFVLALAAGLAAPAVGAPGGFPIRDQGPADEAPAVPAEPVELVSDAPSAYGPAATLVELMRARLVLTGDEAVEGPSTSPALGLGALHAVSLDAVVHDGPWGDGPARTAARSWTLAHAESASVVIP